MISTYLSQQLTGQWRGKKAFKDIEHLKSTNQCDLIGIYRTLKPAEYTLFSSEQGTSTKTDHMLGHETSFNKFKKIEIIQSMFSTTMELN